MRRYLINTVVAVAAMIILSKAAKRELIVKNNICMAGAASALAVGSFIFDKYTMVLWSVLVMQSYTDITEQHLYLMLPRLLAVMEVAYCLVHRKYLDIPLSVMIFPAVLIAAAMLIRAYTIGDMELLLIIMLHTYNQGISPNEYMVSYLSVTGMVFAVYMIVKNVIGMIKHRVPVWKGAFAPAMTVTYFVMFLWKYLS